MTAEDKAKELVDKFYQYFPFQKYVITNSGSLSRVYDSWYNAKQFALICVEEIIKIVPEYIGIRNPKREYWEDVINEIEKL